MPTDNQEKDLFNAALEQPSEERSAFLRGACRGDDALRHRVEGLLQAFASSSKILADEASTVLQSSPLTEGPGTIIGRYKLLEKLGEGGFGAVYVAEQREPVKRRVALKIIKLGMDTEQVVARFEAERQALALMDHPNIAKVLDAGATETGRPYFVMELVRGISMTRYCDENHLTTPERLGLFVQVCQAIQHAHQKGIIHRDIKPSNILITLHDGTPVPKVIDFGIAKATQQELTEKTIYTQFQQFIGTPAYMSPEQAEMSGLDIDTRSDIYSLGVLMYELLVGKTPLDGKELLMSGLDEMRRTIREKEPIRPSTRLSNLPAEELTTTAKHRGADAPKLISVLRGDLDWIVMKCLEKDRTRRYETANGVGADIQRHLNNEPVLARPPSASYRFQKMVRRNKGAFAAASAVGGALVIGVIISTWQAIRAARAERQQSALRQEAETARGAEANQRTLAEQRVYGSLVREARALRLARRVGYRDKVFSLLQQASMIEGAEKDFGELRREAVACLGDFVGKTPVTYTNWPAGFLIMDSQLAPSGQTAAFGLWDRLNKKTALIVTKLPEGTERVRHVTDRDIHGIGFLGNDRLVVLDRPYTDSGERKEAAPNAEVTIWAADQNGEWREVSRRRLPGAYHCIGSSTRSYILVDDPSTGTLKLVHPETFAVSNSIRVSTLMKSPPQVALSSDGEFLVIQTATTPEDPQTEIAIWNLTLGSELRRSPLPASEFIGDLGSNGKHLTVINPEQDYFAVYDTESFKPLARLQGILSSRVSSMAGHNIVALPTYMTREVRLFDYMRQEFVATLNEPRNPTRISFSGDSRSMLTAGVLYARYYNLADGNELRHLKGRPDAPAAVLHPNGSWVATSTSALVLSMHNLETGDIIWRSETPGGAVSFSPDGRLLLAGPMHTQEVLVIDSKTGEKLLTLGTNAFGFVHDALVSLNGRYLVTASTSAAGGGDPTPLLSDDATLGTVSVWDLEYSKTPRSKVSARELRRMVGKYCSFVYLGSSTRIAFMDYDIHPSVYVWDFTTSTSPTKLPVKPRWCFGNLGPTPDGSRLWMIDFDGKLICVDSQTGERLVVVSEGFDRGDIFGVAGVKVSADGGKLAVNSTADRSLEIFDARTGHLIYNLPVSNTAYGFDWASDGHRIVISGFNGDFSVWNLSEVDNILAGLGLGSSDSPSKSAKNSSQR